MPKRLLVSAFALAFAAGTPLRAAPPDTLAAVDLDHDGTISLDEAKATASAKFDALDIDHDGTLDRAEIKGTLSLRNLKKADLDKDGTLTKDEYLAVVLQRFAAANPDKDDTIDAHELHSPAGRALLRLISPD